MEKNSYKNNDYAENNYCSNCEQHKTLRKIDGLSYIWFCVSIYWGLRRHSNKTLN